MRKKYLIAAMVSCLFLIFACGSAAVFPKVSMSDAGIATILFVILVAIVLHLSNPRSLELTTMVENFSDEGLTPPDSLL